MRRLSDNNAAVRESSCRWDEQPDALAPAYWRRRSPARGSASGSTLTSGITGPGGGGGDGDGRQLGVIVGVELSGLCPPWQPLLRWRWRRAWRPARRRRGRSPQVARALQVRSGGSAGARRMAVVYAERQPKSPVRVHGERPTAGSTDDRCGRPGTCAGTQSPRWRRSVESSRPGHRLMVNRRPLRDENLVAGAGSTSPFVSLLIMDECRRWRIQPRDDDVRTATAASSLGAAHRRRCDGAPIRGR